MRRADLSRGIDLSWSVICFWTFFNVEFSCDAQMMNILRHTSLTIDFFLKFKYVRIFSKILAGNLMICKRWVSAVLSSSPVLSGLWASLDPTRTRFLPWADGSGQESMSVWGLDIEFV